MTEVAYRRFWSKQYTNQSVLAVMATDIGVESFFDARIESSGGQEVMSYQSGRWLYYVLSPGETEPTGWYSNSFDDSNWSIGTSAFGSGGTCWAQANVNTNWPVATTILLRKYVSSFTTDLNATLYVMIDNNAKIYWRGSLLSDWVYHSGCPSVDDYSFTIPLDSGSWYTGHLVMHSPSPNNPSYTNNLYLVSPTTASMSYVPDASRNMVTRTINDLKYNDELVFELQVQNTGNVYTNTGNHFNAEYDSTAKLWKIAYEDDGGGSLPPTLTTNWNYTVGSAVGDGSNDVYFHLDLGDYYVTGIHPAVYGQSMSYRVTPYIAEGWGQERPDIYTSGGKRYFDTSAPIYRGTLTVYDKTGKLLLENTDYVTSGTTMSKFQVTNSGVTGIGLVTYYTSGNQLRPRTTSRRMTSASVYADKIRVNDVKGL